MAIINQLPGTANVLANLAKKHKLLERGVSRGLRAAGLTLQRWSQQKVPVDFGPLKASAFTRVTGEGFNTIVNVGYTAFYAGYVHELVEMKLQGLPRRKPSKGRYWDPQGRAQAKFLEEPARTGAKQLNQIIKDHAKI